MIRSRALWRGVSFGWFRATLIGLPAAMVALAFAAFKEESGSERLVWLSCFLVLVSGVAIYAQGRQDGARRMARDIHEGGEPCWRCKGTGVEGRT